MRNILSGEKLAMLFCSLPSVKCFTLLVIFFLTVTGVCSSSVAQTGVFSVQWGESQNRVGYRNSSTPGYNGLSPEGPFNFFISFDGSLFISDTVNRAIKKFDILGDIQAEFANLPGMDSLGYVAVGPDERIYFANREACQIMVLDRYGKLQRRIGRRGNQKGELLSVRMIRIGKDNSIYVLDDIRRKLLRFDASGNFISEVACDTLAFALDLNDGVLFLKTYRTQGNATLFRWTMDGCYPLFPVVLGDALDPRVLGVDANGSVYVSWRSRMAPERVRICLLSNRGFPLTTITAARSDISHQFMVFHDGSLYGAEVDLKSAPRGAIRIVKY